MNIIYFLLQLVGKFVELPDGKYEEIKGKANLWYSKLINKYEIDSNKDLVLPPDISAKDKFQANLIWYNEQWWFQLLLAAFSIKAQRMVANYISDTNKIANGTYQEEVEED